MIKLVPRRTLKVWPEVLVQIACSRLQSEILHFSGPTAVTWYGLRD